MKTKTTKPKHEPMKRGRKPVAPEDRKPPQVTLKINERILPFVIELREELKKGNIKDKQLKALFSVVRGKNPYKQTKLVWQEEIDEITKQKKVIENELYQLKEKMESPIRSNLELKAKLEDKYYKELRKVVDLESRIKNIESEKMILTRNFKDLLNKVFSCQCLTKNGDRCTRPGKVKAKFNEAEINVCLQHKKSLEK